MPRGRPKGSTNKNKLLSQREKDEIVIDDTMNDDEKNHARKMRIIKKCKEAAYDKHWVTWSEEVEK